MSLEKIKESIEKLKGNIFGIIPTLILSMISLILVDKVNEQDKLIIDFQIRYETAQQEVKQLKEVVAKVEKQLNVNEETALAMSIAKLKEREAASRAMQTSRPVSIDIVEQLEEARVEAYMEDSSQPAPAVDENQLKFEAEISVEAAQ